jgi:hypothetical protein
VISVFFRVFLIYFLVFAFLLPCLTGGRERFFFGGGELLTGNLEKVEDKNLLTRHLGDTIKKVYNEGR